MMELERFDIDIMSKATYYEVVDYVADYVQRFLDKVFEGGEIKIPVPIDILLEKLEIEVRTGNYCAWESVQIQGGIYLDFEEKKKYLDIFWEGANNYYITQWTKIKSIARYIVEYHERWLNAERVLLHELEYIQRVARKNEQLIDMVAWQLMLPWKQGIKFLVETQFFDNMKNTAEYNAELIFNPEKQLADAIKLEYYGVQKINAYYNLINTIEAKIALKKIEENELLDFYDSMYDAMGEIK